MLDLSLWIKKTGQACEDFGEKGQISLLAGMGEVKPMYYFVTSPATVASGALVVGGWVADNQEVNEPSGVVRGYSPVTGELLWAWDIGREGQGITKMPPTGETYTRGTPNVWSLTSSDDELGLVYVPTGNATPDYFGGHRTPVMDNTPVPLLRSMLRMAPLAGVFRRLITMSGTMTCHLNRL